MSFIGIVSRIRARLPTIPAIDDSPVPLWPRLVTQVVLLVSLGALGWFTFQRLQALDDLSMDLDFVQALERFTFIEGIYVKLTNLIIIENQIA